MKINLLIVATGKYIQFLPQLLESAEKYFLNGHDVKYCVFTNARQERPTHPNCLFFEVEHKPWPHATLKRFHFFLEHKDNLPNADYFFYCDVDSRFVAPIGEEILSNRTAVQHCGYVDGKNLPFEDNYRSCAYVQKSERSEYYGGGFWGFSATEFWNMASFCMSAIDVDGENGIVPVWHDESILNKYLTACPPNLVLNPSYHYPENNPHIYGKWAAAGKNYDCKILLLDKNHKEVRE